MSSLSETPDAESNWFALCASVAGSSHIASGLPCQDAHACACIGEDWVLSAVSDGAGSSPFADLASRSTVLLTMQYAEMLLQAFPWFQQGRLPTSEDWRQATWHIFASVRQELLAQSAQLPTAGTELPATLIMALGHQQGICIAHIGDGRAAWRNHQGGWSSLFIPTRGEYSHQTVFVCMDLWLQEPTLFGSHVVQDSLSAFALLTDGCENAAFRWNTLSAEGRYCDPNEPEPGFFEPLFHRSVQSFQSGYPYDQLLLEWESFLCNGTPALASESDDKTILLIINKSAI